jgi:hypothetical protein
MTKQTKEKEELRRVGPKFAGRNVLPENFQIRRPVSPMAELLDEADRLGASTQTESARAAAVTPAHLTPVKQTPVESPAVARPRTESSVDVSLPGLEDFLDRVLPRFPPPRQAILLRLYRWCGGVGQEMVVSTPRLAAKTNMDEKVCRGHLHALITEGYILRSGDRGQIARFGGSDRNARGLLLRLSASALSELID